MHHRILYSGMLLLSNITSPKHLVSFTVIHGKVYYVSPKWWLFKIYYSEKKKEILYKEPFKKVRLNLIASDLRLVSLREMVNCNHRWVFYESRTLR